MAAILDAAFDWTSIDEPQANIIDHLDFETNWDLDKLIKTYFDQTCLADNWHLQPGTADVRQQALSSDQTSKKR